MNVINYLETMFSLEGRWTGTALSDLDGVLGSTSQCDVLKLFRLCLLPCMIGARNGEARSTRQELWQGIILSVSILVK